MKIDVPKGIIGEICSTLEHRADMLRRRHPSDGLWQDMYTPEQCVEFKKTAAKLEDFSGALKSAFHNQEAGSDE